MLYNEERPHKFDDMVGQEHIVMNIRNQSINNSWFHSYLFCGQYGSGKTSMARIIELAANCEHKDEYGNPCLECESCKAILSESFPDVVEIDAASNTGVDNIRNIKEDVQYMPTQGKMKIYIIDEVHMLSKGAFNALLKVIEEPPSYVIFILCTTELKAVPATICSRSAKYVFEQIPYADIEHKLVSIGKKKGLLIEEDVYTLIAKNAAGSMRNALSLFEQLLVGVKEKISVSDVEALLGITNISYVFSLLKIILQGNRSGCVSMLQTIISKGKDMNYLLGDMIEVVADLIVAKGSSMEHLHNTEKYKECVKELLPLCNLNLLCMIADGLMKTKSDYKLCPANSSVIVGLLRLIPINHDVYLEQSPCKVVSEESKTETFVKETEIDTKTTNVSEGVSHSQNEIEKPLPKEVVNEDIITDGNTNSTQASMNDETISDKKDDVDSTSEDAEVDETIASKEIESTDEKVFSKDDKEEKPKDENVLSESYDTTENNSEEVDFDPFDLLDDICSYSISDSTEKNSDSKSDSKEMQLEYKNLLIANLDRAKDNNKVLAAALMSCECDFKDGKLIISSALAPAVAIVQKYLEVLELKDIICVKVQDALFHVEQLESGYETKEIENTNSSVSMLSADILEYYRQKEQEYGVYREEGEYPSFSSKEDVDAYVARYFVCIKENFEKYHIRTVIDDYMGVQLVCE